MPSKSNLYILIIIFISLIMGCAFADTYTVSPSGAQSDQKEINKALQKAYDNGGGIVYLTEGDYYITGPLKIGSNTKLTGDKNAIIHVSSSSSQWFVGAVGIIVPLNYPLMNVEICDFQLDGNLMSLPTGYADYAGGDHNAERAIYLQGISNSFMKNIKIHDLQVYNFYSDGIHVQFAQDVQVYSNFVSNCQHSGIFYVSVISGLIQANDVAGLTSDCIRIDNGVNCKITGNVLYSYNGTESNGAYQGGQNLIQIADQG
ncbi:MAG: right-handed parallel beta-helix repeat-containing protein, partial [Methanobacterium sp.]